MSQAEGKGGKPKGKARHYSAIDITGLKCGGLTAIERSDERRCGKVAWRCSCVCGRTDVLVMTSVLTGGRQKSCGCLTKSILRVARSTHGLSKYTGDGATYQKWRHMRARCQSPQHKSYARYGGRGIKVCARWESYEAFYADMGPCPAGKQLDRINNDGDYEPGNCRWVTAKENANNRHNNVVLEYRGERKPIAEWAAVRGLPETTLRKRIGDGWDVTRAMEAPLRPDRRRVAEHSV